MLGDESAVISSIHDGIVPKDVRETDFIHARYRLDGEDSNFREIRVWRISPLGAELVRPETLEGGLLGKGKFLELQIVIEGRRSDFHCAIVDEQYGQHGLELLGVRFLVAEGRDEGDIDDSDGVVMEVHHVLTVILPHGVFIMKIIRVFTTVLWDLRLFPPPISSRPQVRHY